jgi:hypothetical protein
MKPMNPQYRADVSTVNFPSEQNAMNEIHPEIIQMLWLITIAVFLLILSKC